MCDARTRFVAYKNINILRTRNNDGMCWENIDYSAV